MNAFTTQGIIKESWKLFKIHWGILVSAILSVTVVNIAFSILSESEGVTGVIMSIISMFVGLLLQIGLVRLSLNVVDGKPVALHNLVDEYQSLLKVFVAWVLYSVAVIVGLLLLIVPGIIIAIMFSQYTYLIVDRRAGVIESLKLSAALTKGHKLKLFGFFFVILGVILLGVLALGIGLLVAIPVVTVAGAIVYRRLFGAYEGVSAVQAETQETPAAPAPFVPLEQDETPASPEQKEVTQEEKEQQ